jgi:hypothetical protein
MKTGKKYVVEVTANLRTTATLQVTAKLQK